MKWREALCTAMVQINNNKFYMKRIRIRWSSQYELERARGKRANGINRNIWTHRRHEETCLSVSDKTEGRRRRRRKKRDTRDSPGIKCSNWMYVSHRLAPYKHSHTAPFFAFGMTCDDGNSNIVMVMMMMESINWYNFFLIKMLFRRVCMSIWFITTKFGSDQMNWLSAPWTFRAESVFSLLCVLTFALITRCWRTKNQH